MSTGGRREIIEGRLIAMTPAAKCGAQGYTVTVSMVPVLLTVLRTGMAHPAGADIGAGVAENPVARCGRRPPVPFGRRSAGEVADGVIRCVQRCGSEIAAGELNPERTMSIGAGQRQSLQGT